MIFVPLHHLKAGMVIARDIFIDGNTYLPFLTASQHLTTTIIDKLISYKIPGAYINSKVFDDVVVNSLIPLKQRNEICEDMKKIFDCTTKDKAITMEAANDALKIAADIVIDILSKDEYIYNVLDMKNFSDYLYSHGMYSSVISTLIGVKMGLSKNDLVDLATASLLHDIGNVLIPKNILDKNGELTPDERKIMQTHSLLSVKRLRPCCAISSKIISGIVSHHEHFDGTGYPNKLEGFEIPLLGRILILADIYDALTSDRSYRKAFAPNEAVEYMMVQSGKIFDPEILPVFLECVAAYPLGSIVRLSNDIIGVVIKNIPSYPLRPVIRTIGESGDNINIDLAHDENYLNLTVTNLADDDCEINLF